MTRYNMTDSKRISRMGAHSPLVLEGSDNYYHNLTTIKTKNEYKKEVKEKIRADLARWLKNPHFDAMRGGLLDIAVVARVSDRNMRIQDVDNIAKVVLDALKEEKGDSRFLFHDDNQVIRLLIYKLRSEKLLQYNTDSLTISFRVHDSNRQMLLVNPSQIQMVRVNP